MEKLLNNTYTRVIPSTVKSYEWVDTSDSTSQFLTLKKKKESENQATWQSNKISLAFIEEMKRM
jgi:hypothetical protein